MKLLHIVLLSLFLVTTTFANSFSFPVSESKIGESVPTHIEKSSNLKQDEDAFGKTMLVVLLGCVTLSGVIGLTGAASIYSDQGYFTKSQKAVTIGFGAITLASATGIVVIEW